VRSICSILLGRWQQRCGFFAVTTAATRLLAHRPTQGLQCIAGDVTEYWPCCRTQVLAVSRVLAHLVDAVRRRSQCRQSSRCVQSSSWFRGHCLGRDSIATISLMVRQPRRSPSWFHVHRFSSLAVCPVGSWRASGRCLPSYSPPATPPTWPPS